MSNSTMTSKRSERVQALWDLLVITPEWASRATIAGHLGITTKSTDAVVRDLRTTLGQFDEINVVSRPKPGGYRLVGTYEAAQPWISGRVADAETRLETMGAVMASICKATDGRTTEGKRAREIEMTLRHLAERLDVMSV